MEKPISSEPLHYHPTNRRVLASGENDTNGEFSGLTQRKPAERRESN
jgi:hypothetical protein